MPKPLTEKQRQYNESRKLGTLDNVVDIAKAMLADPKLSVNKAREQWAVAYPVARAARIVADSGCSAEAAIKLINEEPDSKTSPIKDVTRKLIHSLPWSGSRNARRFRYVYL